MDPPGMIPIHKPSVLTMLVLGPLEDAGADDGDGDMTSLVLSWKDPSTGAC